MLIKVRDLHKDYVVGEFTVSALRGLDLDIQAGEFVAVLGPSGSGKSTLMHILGCLDTPTSGRYLFNGEDTAVLSDDQLSAIRATTIGFVFQAYNLLPRMNALENVALPLVYSGAASPMERALEALDRVGLADRASHWPNQLSGGQQQRVAIARAFVNEPDLILADEPTGALDTATGEEVMNLLGGLNSKGQTIVLITHELQIAACARRRVTIRDGRITEDTTPPSRPARPRVEV